MKAIIPVFGPAKEYVRFCINSIRKAAPSLEPFEHPYDANEVEKKLARRVNTGSNAYVKAHVLDHCLAEDQLCLRGPILIIDADTLFLFDFMWKPEREETVIAMAPGGDPKYLNWIGQCGLIEIPEDLETVLNCGVIWLRTDVSPLWDKYYPIMADVIENPLVSIGECTWNAIWYHLNREGKAEIMPQEYNNLYVQHGLSNARILHFAGVHPRHKAHLMQDCYNFFHMPTEE